jgi:hypothetical protein
VVDEHRTSRKGRISVNEVCGNALKFFVLHAELYRDLQFLICNTLFEIGNIDCPHPRT